MKLEISSVLFPDANNVSLRDESCTATLNEETGTWSVETALDGCGSTIQANDDGSLAFSNQLQTHAFRKKDENYNKRTFGTLR